MARLASFFLTIIVTTVVGWYVGAVNARAATAAGTIEVTVVNGSRQDSPVPNVAVTLRSRAGAVALPDSQATTDSSGRTRFAGLDASSLASYLVTSEFSGISFESDPITFASGEQVHAVKLQVWETTSVDPGLRATTRLLVLSAPDASSQTISALELVTLKNASTRAFVPSLANSAAPMGLIRFGLPPGSSAVQPEMGLGPSQIVQIPAGIAVAAPLAPGATQLGFAYRFPYDGAAYVLRKNLTYPTDDFRVLAPPSMRVGSAQLQDAGQTTIGSQRYAVLAATGIPASASVTVTIEGLPPPPPWALLARAIPAGGVPAASVIPLALLAAGLPLLYLGRPSRTPSDVAASPPVALARTVAELAELDDRFAAGGLPARDYEERRACLKARAVALKKAAS